ncbi:MAG: SLBB domain-containing protein [Anaeromyxobacter sp.]
MHSLPFRTLALVLAFSPALWWGPAAWAQSALPQAAPAAPAAGGVPDLAIPSADLQPDPRTRLPAASQPPVDEPIDPAAYVCGPGDVFELNLWGIQNTSLRLTVDLEGRVFVPKVGYLVLGGKTLAAARAELKSSVGGLYRRVGVDVALAEPRRFLVQVVDNVAKPGSYAVRAVDRLSTAIAAAGGLGPRPSRRKVEILRRDGTRLSLDLLRFELTGDLSQNPTLLDGDVVRVGFEKVVVSVAGGVNRPGRYELVGSLDLDELVAIAGGLSQSAARTVPIGVIRRADNDRLQQSVHPFGPGGELPAVALQDLDEVQVPTFQDVQRSITVSGALKGAASPADPASILRIPFVDGDSVRDLLERIGSVSTLADLRGSYILRGGASVPVDLEALILRREDAANRPLQLGDTLVVPFKRRDILVQGAVFAPGTYPFNPTFTLEQYIGAAGGRNRFAKPLSDVRLITPDGKTHDFDRRLSVEPGSSIVVAERDFSRAEIVQIAISIASVLISGATIYLAARK